MAASIGEDIATNAPSYLLEKSAAGVSSPTRPGADLFAYVSRTTPDVRFAFPASATPINAPELTCAYASRFHLFTYPRAPFLCIFSLFLSLFDISFYTYFHSTIARMTESLVRTPGASAALRYSTRLRPSIGRNSNFSTPDA